MSLITDIADAVAVAISDHTFTLPLMVSRAYLPRHELAQLNTLKVTVVPKAIDITSGTRAANQHDCQIDVAIQQHIETNDGVLDTDRLDALMSLTQEIADHIRFTQLLDTEPRASWVRTENSPVYDPDHLGQQHAYTSVLTFTFKVVR